MQAEGTPNKDSPARVGVAAYLRRPVPIEMVYLLAPVFVVVMAALLNPIKPYDYFWALAQGRTIAQMGGNPSQNLFLYTLPTDAPYFNQPWLAQVILYALATKIGHAANVVLLAGALGIAMLLAVDAGVRSGARARRVALVAMAAAPFLAIGAGVRTQLFAFPCFAAAAWMLFVPGWGWSRVAGMALVSAAYANLHGSFVLLPLLAAVAMVAKRGLPVGARIAAPLASALAACAHPEGVRIYGYVAGLSRAMGVAGRASVEEWRHLSPASVLGAAFTVAVILFAVVALRGRWRARGAQLASLFALVAAAYFTQRFVPFAALMAPFALPASRRIVAPEDSTSPAQGRAHAVFLAAFLVVGGLCLPGAPLAAFVSRGRSSVDAAFSVEVPLALAAKVATWPGTRSFHTQAVGGLVEWSSGARGPAPVAFVDQRFEIIPDRVWRDYADVCKARGGFGEILGAHHVGAVLAEPTEAGPLLRSLAVDPGWVLVGEEGPYRLYARAVPVEPGRR